MTEGSGLALHIDPDTEVVLTCAETEIVVRAVHVPGDGNRVSLSVKAPKQYAISRRRIAQTWLTHAHGGMQHAHHTMTNDDGTAQDHRHKSTSPTVHR